MCDKCRSIYQSVRRLDGRTIGWLEGWTVGLLDDWTVGRLDGEQVVQFGCKTVGRLIDGKTIGWFDVWTNKRLNCEIDDGRLDD